MDEVKDEPLGAVDGKRKLALKPRSDTGLFFAI
jgi:hypothetical protein